VRYWWVNQNQTFRQETAGGYLWSPKRKANGNRNPFYEFMREVSPGDLVFSFCDARIKAFGIARSYGYEAAKPAEFGQAGRNWEHIGWRIDVEFHEAPTLVRPSDWIDQLRPLLPSRYAPLDARGRGSQSMYLTELPEPLALALANLLGTEVAALARTEVVQERELAVPTFETVLWEEQIRRRIEIDPVLDSTEREALILSRRGQGLFRSRVQTRETQCRITGVSRPEHLRASHCKPWRDSSNAERLDGENGLLLTPSIDHLFDRGFISFRDDGRLLVSGVAHAESLRRMGVPEEGFQTGTFGERQRPYLEFHRDMVFLRAQLRTTG
jgi:hypothetical protein